ncbi:MAG: TIGR02117 family protein [Leptolyngbyaceae cyanobacterium bins.59]|nr:TIGR02117 family protein [Leptolyngbyaceae cyanobacterium bins.59]
MGLVLVSFVMVLAIGYFTPTQWFTPQETCTVTLYVSSDNFHTNLILPVQNERFDWRQRLGLSMADTGQYRYLGFGWGERAFYVETPSWDQVNVWNALRALFWLNSAAMNVYGYPDVPQSAGNTFVRPLKLSQSQYERLIQFLDGSFQRDDRQQVQRIRSRDGTLTNFFEATGRYSILKTCNSWTADGLRAAHLNTPMWAGLASAVMMHLRDGCL